MTKRVAQLRWRKIRLPFKLVLVFMPLILLPALTGIYLTTRSYTTSSKQLTSRYASDLLGLMAQKIDDRLRGYEQLSKQIMTDEELHRLLAQKADSSFEQFRIEREINESINVLWLGDDDNKYIRSIKIESPNGSYTYGTDAVDGYAVGDPDYQNQVRERKGSAAWFAPASFTDGYRELDAFRLGRTIRDKQLNELGEMTLVIDVQAIASIFAQTNLQDDAVLRLLGPDGQELLGNGRTPETNDNKILAYSQDSLQNGWSLSAQLPLEQLYRPITTVTRQALVVLLACIALALAVTQLLALDLVIPIRKLMVNMKQGIKGTKPAELKTFKGAVEIIEMNDTFISVMYEIEQLIQQVVRQEKKKRDAEIRMLHTQLSPHFMYNTLNSIRWMAMIQKQDNIKEMIDAMNRLLTRAVRGSGGPVTLAEELEALNDYVAIKKVRYQQFTLERDISPPLLKALLLPFTLQPLIENALLHGLANADRSGVIRLSAMRHGATVELAVTDNGIGMTPERLAEVRRKLELKDPAGDHVGLRNVHERLQLHYGAAFGLRIDSRTDAGTAVTIRLPYRESEAGETEMRDHA